MADDLPSTITEVAGQAATVRVGTVTAVNPLAINLGGTQLDMDAVGNVSTGALYAIGMPVALLGQAVQGGATSGATWLLLGPIGAASTPGGLHTVSLFVVNQLLPDSSNESFEWFAANYDTDNFWDPVSGFADVILPFDGIYTFQYQVVFDPGLAVGSRKIWVTVSGGRYAEHRHNAIVDSSIAEVSFITTSFEGLFTAGQIVNFDCYQTSGVTIGASAFATIRYIGSL